MARYDLRVNGFARFAEADDPDKPLLYVLRDMGLTAAKYGCGLGQCGACTVLIDGAPARSCQTRVADLKGKTITTMSYQDTTFYALLGLMASAGLTQNDVNVQQVGPTGVWQFVAEGKSAGMAGVPDWIPPVQAAGVKVRVIPTETFFPHMAQGIAASDDIIKQKPEMIRKFVKAALRGMKDMMDNPDKAADEFVSFVPEWKGKENQVKYAFNMYAKDVYPGQTVLGEMNADRLSKLQDFYLAKGFIQKATPVNELYTNEFVS